MILVQNIKQSLVLTRDPLIGLLRPLPNPSEIKRIISPVQTLQTLNKKIMNKNQVEIQGLTANGSRELSREFVSCSFILWEGNWGIV